MANIGNLYADLTTSSAAFQKDMGKAANSVRSSSAKMNRNLARLEKNFYGIQRSVKRTVKSMFSLRSMAATVAGSAGIGYAIKSSLDFADAIGKTADRIGLTTDALQQYRHAAKLSGVAQSTLDKGFEAFAKRLGEARAGTGAMVTYLKKYDKAILDSLLSTSSTEEALQIMFRTMDKMSNASDRAALSAAAFSRTAGVQMANLVREGASGLEDMLREARDLGLVIDESLIRGAEKANDSVTRLGGVLKTQMIATLLELAPTITEVSDNMVNWIKANRELIEQKVEKTISNISSSLDAIVSVYDSLPSGVVGAAGYGLAGRIIFGGAAGKTIAMIVLLNETLKTLNLNITSIPGKTASLNENIQNILDVITGKKDWNTGADLTGGNIKDSWMGRALSNAITPEQLTAKTGGGDTGVDYNTWVKDYTSKLGTFIDYWDDSWLRMDRRVSTVGDDIIKEYDNWEKNYIATLNDMVDYSSDSWLEIAQIVKDQNEKTVTEIDKTYDNMIENIQGAFADTFYDIFSGQLDSFEDFADSMKNIFFRTLSEMAAKSLTTKLFSDTGLLGGLSSGIGIPIIGGLLGLGGALLGGLTGENRHNAGGKFALGDDLSLQTIKGYRYSSETKAALQESLTPYQGLWGILNQSQQESVLSGIGRINIKARGSKEHLTDRLQRELEQGITRLKTNLDSAFLDVGQMWGFTLVDSMIEAVEKEKNALGNAFQAALTTGSWMSFKTSIAEQIHSTIIDDLTQQLIQSQAIQGALMPIYGQIEKGMTAATAGGGFNAGIFGQYATGAAGQLNNALTPIKPAFDAMAALSQKLKDLMIGSFANGGVVPETGLAMVHKGEHISSGGGTVVINADVITTNDVDTWLAERIQRIETLRVGKKISKVEMTTQGLDI